MYEIIGMGLQLAVLRKGLDLHGKRIGPALLGMQQNLDAKLELMESEVRGKKVCPHPTLLPSLTASLPPSLTASLPPSLPPSLRSL